MRPDETYTVKVTISPTMGDPNGFGFQILCLNAPVNVDGPEISTWANPSTNAKISTALNTSRTYVEHNGPSSTNEFTVEWTAPAAGAGEVTFYSCGNGVNMDGNTTGDAAACNTLTLTEGEVLNTGNPDVVKLHTTVFPNPVSEMLYVHVHSPVSGNYALRVLDVTGNTVLVSKEALVSGQNNVPVEIADIPVGIYTVVLEGEGGIALQKFLKQ